MTDFEKDITLHLTRISSDVEHIKEKVNANFNHLEKVNGMWAFAIWDNIEKRLFLSRDRFGVKPLFFLNEI